MKTEKISPLKNITALVIHFLSQLPGDDDLEQKAVILADRLTVEIPQLKQHLRMEQIDMKPRDFRPLIHATQQELMVLTGSLTAYVDAQELCEPTTPLSRLCHRICNELNELIQALSKQYASCLPQHIYAPEGYRTITAYQIFHGLADLVEALKAHDTDPALIDILMVPFSACTQDGTDITLAQLNFLKLLKLQLHNLVQQASEQKAPVDEIIQVMFRALNFNSLTALQYTMRRIHDTLQALDSKDARHQYLAYCRMSILITPPLETGLGLNPELPSLHDQLMKWVNDEDDRLMRMDRSEPIVLNLAPKMPIGIPNTHHALLTKIQIKAGGYTCSQYQAIKLCPQIFCTANGDPIGDSAYGNSFKDITPSAARGVLKYLEACIHILKTDCGDLL